jgi:dTDP-glucose 4,6-dehydratase
MRVIVTGGAGFIGSAVCRHFVLQQGWTVLNIDKLTYAASLASLDAVENDSRYRFVQGDICDRGAIERALDTFSPQAVVHLAAETHVDRSIDGSAEFIRTNVIGTHTLLETCRRYWTRLSGEDRSRFRFVHVSTDEVYGSLGPSGQFSESSAYDPRSPYAASKAGSDHLARAWYETYGLPVILSNCSNNYGPYHFPEKLIPLTILNALQDKALPVYGDGLNVRDWLYVEDHARALTLVLERGGVGHTYNIGGRNERTNMHVVTTICDLLDRFEPSPNGSRQRLISFVTDRPGHDRRYAIDATKLETELGWRAAETFETGLAKTVQWYLANKPWWQTILERGYKATRIGVLQKTEHVA